MKQILVLDDLGVGKLNDLVNKYELDYQLCFDAKSTDSQNVEGVITVTSKVDEKLLNSLPNIKFVAVAFTGYDCVDLNICKKRNIAVYNVPSYSTDSVAELVLGLAISLLRNIPKGIDALKNGSWNSAIGGSELKAKKIGIIGTGNIGCRVAELFTAFGCEVYAWSRSERKEFIDAGGIYVSDLKEMCSKVDILSLHIPLNETTKGFINEDYLDCMKETAFLINASRGAVVKSQSLVNVLRSKKIAGAALDVYDVEPIDMNNPLIGLGNVILTPHIAFKTKEALQRRAEITLNNILSFLQSKDSNRVC